MQTIHRSPTATQIRTILDTEPYISAKEIALRLGISRQRVYQAAKKAGLKFNSAWPHPSSNSEPKSPTARVKIAGLAAKISPTCAGTVSELLVAADLIARGFKPYTPFIRQRSHDLICISPTGKIVTIEVRAGYRKANGTLQLGKKIDCQSEILASVFIDSPVIYSPELPT